MAAPVPAGPLAVRWLSHEVPPQRAGKRTLVAVEAENAGTVAWRGSHGGGIQISYHWLDLRGNPIVWAGIFTPVLEPVAPGGRATLQFVVEAPIPPGRYRLALDLVDEGRAWFGELGNQPLELDMEVAARIAQRALSVRIGEGPPQLVDETVAALAAQDEPVVDEGEATAFLAPGCRPAPDWSGRLLDAHAEGYAVVGGSVELEGGLLVRRRIARELEPWRPGFGRSPAWALPLVCPSVATDTVERAPWIGSIAGLPTLDPSRLDEPWLCDGRIRLSIAAKALPRAARRSA